VADRSSSRYVDLSTIKPGELILLVEDEPAIGEMLVALLTSHEYKVKLVPNASDARGLEPHVKYEIGLVITDLNTSGSDGLSWVKEIREIFKCAMIVVSSGSNVPDDAGHDDCLGKPYTSEALFAVVDKWNMRRRISG
jgi:DNA-binding response OmpR family regulator